MVPPPKVDDSWDPKVNEQEALKDRRTALAKADLVAAETERQHSWLKRKFQKDKPSWRPAKWHRLAARRRTRHLDNAAPIGG